MDRAVTPYFPIQKYVYTTPPPTLPTVITLKIEILIVDYNTQSMTITIKVTSLSNDGNTT